MAPVPGVLALLAVASFCFSLHVALVAPPLAQDDERSHAAYAVALYQGHLPTIDTAAVDDPDRFPQIARSLQGQDAAHRDIWTANHPPLYYALSVPMIALGDATDQPGAALLAMRLVNAAGMAWSVALLGLLARELVPRRPAVPVLAAAIAASCVTVSYLGGFIFNDGLGTAAIFWTLLMGCRMLRSGLTRPRLLVAVLAGTAAAALRAPGVVAVAACVGAVVLAVLLRDRSRRGVRDAALAAALVGGVPALATGWFYLRNLDLYGDVGGTGALLEKFGRRPNGTVGEVATDPAFWRAPYEGLWVRRDLAQHWTVVPDVLLLIATAGLVVAAVGWAVRRARRTDPPDADPAAATDEPRLAGLAVWLMMLGFAALVTANVIDFRAQGGSNHMRYAIPVLPLLTTALAVGLLGLGSLVPVSRRRTARRDLGVAALASAALLGAAVPIQLASSRALADEPGSATVGGLLPVLAFALAVVAAAVAVARLAQQALRTQRSPAGRHAQS